MIKKKIFKALCAAALGCVICTFSFLNTNLKTSYAQEGPDKPNAITEENETGTITINSTTTKSDIERIVSEGCFNSSKLTKSQIEHIYSLYDNDPQTITELQKQSDYNQGAPVLYSTYTHSPLFNGYTVVDGIDVSQWNGDIDWDMVKASGVDFVFIRVAGRYYGGGGYFTDDNYKQNIEGALAAGLDVGVYIFSAAISTTEAKAEAAYTMNLIKDYNITLPIVMDYEYGPGPSGRLYEANLSKAAATNIVNTFCNAVEAKGYVGMIYASKSVLAEDMNAAAIATKYPVWNAQYNDEDTLTSPHSYWQYSSTGIVPGISYATDLNFRYIKKPNTVTSLSYEATDNSITLSWKKVPEAYGYQIARYDEANDKYVVIASVKGASTTKYKNKSLIDGKTYKYKVRAYYKLKSGNKYGNYSSEFKATTISDQVKNVKLSGITDSSIKISWTEKGSVSGYRILRSKGTSTNYSVVKTITSATTSSYTDSGLLGGTKYNYKVQSYSKSTDGTVTYHDPSDIKSATTLPGAVTGLKASKTTTDSITLTWNKQADVIGYKVYVWNNATGKWRLLAKLSSPSKNKYTHSSLTANKEYKYSVVAYYASGNSTKNTKRSSTLTAYTGVYAVSGLKASDRTANSITLTWNKRLHADGYVVYMYDPSAKKNVLVKRITSKNICSYKATDIPSGRERTFTVMPYRLINGIYYYGTGAEITICTKPVATSKVTYKNFGSYTILSWKKVSGGNGYVIYKYNKDCTKRTKIATIQGSNTLTYIAPKLSSGETYRVVTYKKSGSKNILSNRSAAPVLNNGVITGIVNADVVNVRRDAGTNYSIITEATKNTTVTILGIKKASGSIWYKISLKEAGNTITGYMSGDYITLK
ncbi:MAG: GH25 family lysozyme [Coprococcus sp.]